MNTVYIGNTLVNDIFLGSKRIDEVGVPKGPLSIYYLVGAGGGASGYAQNGVIPGSGGGGAGGVLTGSILLQPTNTSYSIRVGLGGQPVLDTNGGNGATSSIAWPTTSSIAYGGGGGGYAKGGGNQSSGVAGASGGGGASNQVGGAGIAGQGNNGGSGNGSNISGGGGGAATKGGSNTGIPAGASGSGSIWIDNIEYGIGGGGDGSSYNRYSQGSYPYINGGYAVYQRQGEPGGNGLVKIAYAGSGSVAIGGTISYSNGYTYHTFTGSATFTY